MPQHKYKLRPEVHGELHSGTLVSGVARTQPMPGHSVGTLRLQVASNPGPTQL